MKNTSIIFLVILCVFILTSCGEKKTANEYFESGLLELKNKNYQSAIINLEHSIRINPKNYLAHYWLAVSYLYAEYSGAAVISELKTTINLNPSYPDAYRELGIIYAKLNKYEESREYLEKAKSMNDNDVLTLANLGYVYVQLKEFEEAKKQYEEALSIQPNNILALNNYGLLYFKTNNHLKAEEYFLKSIFIIPNQPEIYDYLSKIEENKGNKVKAKEYLKKKEEFRQ